MTGDNEWSENLEQIWVEETVRRNAEIEAGTALMRVPKMYLETQEIVSKKG